MLVPHRMCSASGVQHRLLGEPTAGQPHDGQYLRETSVRTFALRCEDLSFQLDHIFQAAPLIDTSSRQHLAATPGLFGTPAIPGQ